MRQALLVAAALTGCAPALGGRCEGDLECAPGRCVAGACTSESEGPGEEAGPGGDAAGQRGDTKALLDDAGRPADAVPPHTDGGTTPDTRTHTDADPPSDATAPFDGWSIPDIHPPDAAPPDPCAEGRQDCPLPHGLGLCRDGACHLDRCDEGWFDLDADPANGCERGCDPPAPGLPVGAPAWRTAESPAPAVLDDGTPLVALSVPDGDDQRLVIAGPPDHPWRVGEMPSAWRWPALAASEGWVAVAARREAAPQGPVFFGARRGAPSLIHDAGGSEAGRPVLALWSTPEGTRYALAATGRTEDAEGLQFLVTCGDAEQRRDPAKATPEPASNALPALAPLPSHDRVAALWAEGAMLHVRLLEPGCGVAAVADLPLPYAPLGLTAAWHPEHRVLAVALSDATRLTFASLTLAPDATLQARIAHDEPGRAQGATPSIVATGGGFWVLTRENDRLLGLPLGPDARPVFDAVPLFSPPAGSQIERPRAASHPDGLVAAWIQTPAGSSGEAGEVHLGTARCR